MKKIIWFIVIVLLAIGVYFVVKTFSNEAEITENQEPNANTPGRVATSTEDNKPETVIGKSVQNRDIIAYHYGEGRDELLFIGGIHGGYEWNTSLLAFQLMDYLEANPRIVPENVKITVIPVMNPDGLFRVAGKAGRFSPNDVPSVLSDTVPGRFNANQVDLNRNFDCDWKQEAVWQRNTVSGGSRAFSEPESLAVKNYVEAKKPKAAVVWYSSAGGVFASNCHGGVLPETNAIMKKYSDASGYKSYPEFDFYEVTGDMVNWLAKINIPAVSVLLTNHTDTEWTKNQKGIDALLNYYAK